MNRPSVRFVPTCLAAFLLLILCGCASNDRRAAMEEARKAVPPMAANDTFFDGKLVAALTVNSAFADEAPGGSNGTGAGGHKHGGGGGMHGHHGGGAPSTAATVENTDPEASDQAHSPYVESSMPPAMLRLRLENKSAEIVTVEITDLNSELGNFAVRPDKYTLQPGAVGEPNGMQSLLGLDTLALPVTLTLKVGGKSETKILTLHVVTTLPASGAAPTTP